MEGQWEFIFFQCIITAFVWSCFKEALGWNKVPDNLGVVFWEWIPLGSADYNLKLFSFAVIWWSFWLSLNKMILEKKFPNQPCDVLYSISFKMQKWEGCCSNGHTNWRGSFRQAARGNGKVDGVYQVQKAERSSGRLHFLAFCLSLL